MSKGLGKVQRAVLGYLGTLERNQYGAWEHAPVRRIAAEVFANAEPTDAQVSATRRAVRTLARAGLAIADRDWDYDGRTYERISRPYRITRNGRDEIVRGLQTVHISETWASLPPNPTPAEQLAAEKHWAELVAEGSEAYGK